jgi:hypothetical protein
VVQGRGLVPQRRRLMAAPLPVRCLPLSAAVPLGSSVEHSAAAPCTGAATRRTCGCSTISTGSQERGQFEITTDHDPRGSMRRVSRLAGDTLHIYAVKPLEGEFVTPAANSRARCQVLLALGLASQQPQETYMERFAYFGPVSVELYGRARLRSGAFAGETQRIWPSETEKMRGERDSPPPGSVNLSTRGGTDTLVSGFGCSPSRPWWRKLRPAISSPIDRFLCEPVYRDALRAMLTELARAARHRALPNCGLSVRTTRTSCVWLVLRALLVSIARRASSCLRTSCAVVGMLLLDDAQILDCSSLGPGGTNPLKFDSVCGPFQASQKGGLSSPAEL